MEGILKVYENVAGILWNLSSLYIVNIYAQVFTFLQVFLSYHGVFGGGEGKEQFKKHMFLPIVDSRE